MPLKWNKYLIFLVVMAHICVPIQSQEYVLDEQISSDSNLSKAPFIYRPDSLIKTPLIHKKGLPNSRPVISVHGGQLHLSFDDLRNEFIEYQFKIFHCDRDWNIVNDNEMEYFESLRSRYLEDNEFSSATKVPYNHYFIDFPREDERFIRSGNFLIGIQNVENDSIVLYVPFMVVQGGINVNAKISRPDDVQYYDYKQQVKFELYDPQKKIEDMSRLKIVVQKNNSPELRCTEISPSFVSGDKIVFERLGQCMFDGGNEYRAFNVIDLKNISNNIVKVEFVGHRNYHMWLDLDQPRSYLKYVTNEDINGRILYSGHNVEFEATHLDYVNVHFTLKTETPMLGYEIYVFGELSDYRTTPSHKMKFNSKRNTYELDLLLKQGYYNYQYVVRSVYQDGVDESLLEGSHFETENDYSVLVYYNSPFEGYDQLLAVEQLNSMVMANQLYKNK